MSSFVGKPIPRVDGILKVTGQARYAADRETPDLLHGCMVTSPVAKGRILSIDAARALKIPGVVKIFTHENRGNVAWLNLKWKDMVAPPGHPFRPLYSDRILFADQPVAVVIAESFEAARDAASLVEVRCAAEPHGTDFHEAQTRAYRPPHKRLFIPRPPKPRGDARAAFREAPLKIEAQYAMAPEHHNPMEMFGTTCVYQDGKLTLYDKTQGSKNVQGWIAKVFGLSKKNVRVVNEFVGGAFGSGLRPQAHAFCAVLASLQLKRSVRVTVSRQEMFQVGYRPDTLHTIGLSCDRDGKLQSISHETVAATSRHEDYQENLVNWSGMLYHCDNVRLDYKLTKLDTCTPCDMRAPGAASGVNVFECAIDELAHQAGIDPLEFRRRNYALKDENQNKPFTSKSLDQCYAAGAKAFRWSERPLEPRGRKDGRELIGWGMANSAWDAMVIPHRVKAGINAAGHLTVSVATSDIGTGTYTILTQIAAEQMGLPLEKVTAKLGDSDLPFAPVEGGSWTAASAGAAVHIACEKLRKTLFSHARKMTNSPLAGASYQDVEFANAGVSLRSDPARGVSIAEILLAAERPEIDETGMVLPDVFDMLKYVSNTHSAVFAEVRVDEELGVMRVTRVVCAVAAGRILNPMTARSQILGGVVMGIGMALHEETMTDHRLGRIVNHNFAEYHIPSHADIHDIEVIFIDEKDEKTSPLGVKGLGEIGIVGAAAAVANAIFHATGKRVREFPITIDRLLTA